MEKNASSLTFALLIMGPPFSSGAAHSALAFAKAALAQEHALFRVFFYLDGVGVANRLSDPGVGHPPIVRDWSKFALANKIDLVVCINAGKKRGVREANLAPGFRISGLGQLVEAGMLADRLIAFGD